MAKWRVTKNGELRKSGELREKSELRIATPIFRNSPLIFKLTKGELREVLTLHLNCLIKNAESREVLRNDFFCIHDNTSFVRCFYLSLEIWRRKRTY